MRDFLSEQLGQQYRQGQLAFDLDVEEEEVERGLSKEEKTRRSEAARLALESTGCETLPSARFEWMEEYFQLRDAGLPWRIATYIAWAASPKKTRKPKTQGELATLLGLASDRVIYQWRRKNPEIDAMISVLQAAPLLAHRRDIYEALIESASDPDHRSNPDRKLALELMGDYTPRSKVDVEGLGGGKFDLENMSDEDLDRLLASQGKDVVEELKRILESPSEDAGTRRQGEAETVGDDADMTNVGDGGGANG